MKSSVLGLFLLCVLNVNADEQKLKPIKSIFVKQLVQEMKFKDFHNYHVGEFAKAEGFAMERTLSMPKVIHVVVEGKKYQMTNMRLLSVTDRKKPVMWEVPPVNGNALWLSDGIDRSMLKNKHMKKRSLTEKELMSMKKLRQGGSEVLAKNNGVLELMAPLHAGPSCTRCHEDYKKDEFMGAFLYSLNELGNGLNKKEEPKKEEVPQKENKHEKLSLSAK